MIGNLQPKAQLKNAPMLGLTAPLSCSSEGTPIFKTAVGSSIGAFLFLLGTVLGMQLVRRRVGKGQYKAELPY